MTSLEYNYNLKMLRETLCEAQTLQVFLPMNVASESYLMHLQNLVNEIDRHRPLGPDGKHGDLHTDTCGCEDKPHGEWCPGTAWWNGRDEWRFTCDHHGKWCAKDCEHHGPWCDHTDCPDCRRGFLRHRKCLVDGHDWSDDEMRQAKVDL